MIKDETVIKDILWGMYQENVTHGRHLETLRANVTSSLVAIYVVVFGIITFDKEISRLDLPLTFFLIVLGIYGSLFVFKYYERFSLHMQRARNYRNAIDELFKDSFIKPIKNKSDEEHKEKFPKFSKYHLNRLWVYLHLFVTLIGVIMSIFAAFFPFKVTN